MIKVLEKNQAIELRKQGFSYNEILQIIPVAKSTLSLWLRDVGLAKREKQRLSERKKAAQLKGGEIKRQQRRIRSNEIREQSLREIGKVSERELKLIGAALYWAEGSKQKETNVSQRVSFSNSDPFMINLVCRWLESCCQIGNEDIRFDLSIHETGDLKKAKKFWAKSLRMNLGRLRVYLKRHKITVRKNVGVDYNGLIRINVRRSTDLNRRINGWIEGIYQSVK